MSRLSLRTVVAAAIGALLSLSASPATAAAGAERVAGGERYATAAQISSHLLNGPVDQVLIANGHDFPDALAGGAAGARQGAPLLLVERDRVPLATAAELARLQPRVITVLGGDSAVSPSVEDQLRAHASAQVTRWSGTDRYATSVEISRLSTTSADVVYVAAGDAYADALTGSAAAGVNDAPLLLVKPDAVPSSVRGEIARLAPRRVVILGGTARVADRVARELSLLTDDVQRVDGPDRYATSALLAEHSFPSSTDAVVLTVGTNFPDALAGALLARSAEAPMLLVGPTHLPSTVAGELRGLAPERVVALGGTAAVSETVLRQATAAAGGPRFPVGDGDVILAAPSATREHLQSRARAMGANDLFVTQMTPALHRAALRYGIDPTVMVAQAYHETGGGHFGRAVTPLHHNTCGLKVRNPVHPDDHPDAHARFASWDEGAIAHAQHLYAYLGVPLPPGERNVDPRWDWVYGYHEVTAVTELSGKWAPSGEYGDRVHAVARRLLAG